MAEEAKQPHHQPPVQIMQSVTINPMPEFSPRRENWNKSSNKMEQLAS